MWGQKVCGKSLYLLLNFAVNLKLLLKIKSIFLKCTKSKKNTNDTLHVLVTV